MAKYKVSVGLTFSEIEIEAEGVMIEDSGVLRLYADHESVALFHQWVYVRKV